MNHKQRAEACEVVSNKLLRKYPKDIIATGIAGSVARGADLEYSDVDFQVLVRERATIESHVFVLRGCLFGVYVRTERSWMREFEKPYRNLALAIGSLNQLVPIHDPSGAFSRLKKAAMKVPDARWRDSAREGLEDTIEDLGRCRNSYSCRNWDNLVMMTSKVALSYANLCALLTRKALRSENDLVRIFSEEFGPDSKPARMYRLAARLDETTYEEQMEALEWLFVFLVKEARKQSAAHKDLKSPKEYRPP